MTTRTSPSLTGSDLETWNSYLQATRLLLDALDRRLSEEADISLPDFIVLFRLSHGGDDGMRMSELADAAVFSRSRISHAFGRLEKQGWVERRSCPTDRRGSFGFLTDSGREKLRLSEPIHAEVVQQNFIDAVGAESKETLRSVTDKMRTLLGTDPSDPAC